MDFDLSFSDLDAATSNLNMQSILPTAAVPAAPAPGWNPSAADLVSVPLPDPLALASLPQSTLAELTAHMQLPAPVQQPAPVPAVGQKRTHAEMLEPAPASLTVSELTSSHTTHTPSSTNTQSLNSESHPQGPTKVEEKQVAPPACDGDVAAAAAGVTTELLAIPEIDPNAVCQMGGLPYAELCKERAREEFKEAKRNEHLANGDFDRTKRRKKNDTSMTPRQKYIRRLRMNQDSAAAARHAQEVYVSVLEKLVKTSEAEKKSFSLEMQHIRDQNALLQKKVCDLQGKVTELEEDQQEQKVEAPPPSTTFDWEKTKDPLLATKLLDFIANAPVITAQADLGVQPARAV